jgi:hypothetical protein
VGNMGSYVRPCLELDLGRARVLSLMNAGVELDNEEAT